AASRGRAERDRGARRLPRERRGLVSERHHRSGRRRARGFIERGAAPLLHAAKPRGASSPRSLALGSALRARRIRSRSAGDDESHVLVTVAPLRHGAGGGEILRAPEGAIRAPALALPALDAVAPPAPADLRDDLLGRRAEQAKPQLLG